MRKPLARTTTQSNTSTEWRSRYTAEKQKEREESGAAARHGGSKHTNSMPEHARERKAKKSLKVEGWDYMMSLPNPRRSTRSARPSASPTLPCPSARAPRVGRTAASHPYLRVVTAPVHKRSHSKSGRSHPAKYQN